MKWILISLAGLFAVVTIIAIVGATLPRTHVASRTMRVGRTPQEVWPVIIQLMTSSSVPVDVIESDPPRRLVSRVKETEKMFGGTWTVLLAPVDGPPASAACTVTITEDGWVANPIFRFVSRFIIGHHATMDGILKDVATTFGEEPALSGE